MGIDKTLIRTGWVRPLGLGLGLAVLAACASPTLIVTHDQQIDLSFPSPLSGPGRPTLSRPLYDAVDQGWRSLSQGNTYAVAAALVAASDCAPGRLLHAQTGLVDGSEGMAVELGGLAEEFPEYAAVWLTLSVAAEQENDEATALKAAKRGAELWGKAVWKRRFDDLYWRWVEERVLQAAILISEGSDDEALAIVDLALTLDPVHRDGLLAKAEILIGRGDPSAAEAMLKHLPDDPEAVFLTATIAEQRREWLPALDLYDSLPDGFPQRDRSLRRVQLWWRLSNLPGYVHQALAAENVTRADLAVLLVSLVPQIEAAGSGQVPLLSDIVELPSYREIVAAVRGGVMLADPLEHRFYPEREARPSEIRSAIESLCNLLGLRPPPWCEPGSEVGSCTGLTSPVSGNRVAEVVLVVVQGEAP